MKRVSLFAFDFILLGATLILMVVGILFVYSSGMSFTGMQLSNEYVKQLIWSGTGLLLMIGVIMIDYHRLRRLAVETGATILVVAQVNRDAAFVERTFDPDYRIMLQSKETKKLFPLLTVF